MTIHEPGIYHIYNRGNNKQIIFFSNENYFYFLRKCHQYIKPVSNILAWCLMPNHFHFLIDVTYESLRPLKSGGIVMPAITNAFRLLQSSYAKGVNKQQNRSGNLFQQKTKAKLTSSIQGHSFHAFNYIHQNPMKANLVVNPEDWIFSSLQDYLKLRNGSLCNYEKAYELLGLKQMDLKAKTLEEIGKEIILKIS